MSLVGRRYRFNENKCWSQENVRQACLQGSAKKAVRNLSVFVFCFFFFKSGTYSIPKEHKILGHIDQTPAIPFSIALEASLIHSSQQNGMIPWFTISRLLFKP